MLLYYIVSGIMYFRKQKDITIIYMYLNFLRVCS